MRQSQPHKLIFKGDRNRGRKMNLLEHYIKEIHNVEDVSDNYEKAIGHKPKEPLYEVDVTFDCYGVVERDIRFMDKSEFEQAKKQGYFLA